jgi:hypothetical protein
LRFFPSGRFLYKVIIWCSFWIHFKNIWFSYMCDWLYEKLTVLYRILLKRSRMWWSAWTFGHPNQTLSLVDTTHWQMTRYALSLSLSLSLSLFFIVCISSRHFFVKKYRVLFISICGSRGICDWHYHCRLKLPSCIQACSLLFWGYAWGNWQIFLIAHPVNKLS